MIRLTAIVTILGLALGAGAVRAGGAADAVTASAPYARAVPPGQTNSAMFMRLANDSDMDHALVGAESSVSDVVELHTHTMDEGMMKMRRIERIWLPARESVTLEPGGLHLMLIGLKRQLVPDEQVDLTLIFEDESRTQLTAPVRKIEMGMGGHDKNHKCGGGRCGGGK